MALFFVLLTWLERLTQVHDPLTLIIMGVATVAGAIGGLKLVMYWRCLAEERRQAERVARWRASQQAKARQVQAEQAAPSEAKPEPPAPKRRGPEVLERFDE